MRHAVPSPDIGASLDAGMVAARFLRSKDWLLRARPALEREGFPPPITLPPARQRRGRGRPEYIWDAAAVAAWFAAQAPRALHPAMGLNLPANENTPGDTIVTPTAAKLEGRLL